VIHVGTLHYRDARWIEPQLHYLQRHTPEPYRTYASLEKVGPEAFGHFDVPLDHSGRVPPKHADTPENKLSACVNAVGEAMIEEADPDDLIVFMHSDTLPIGDWTEPVRRMLAEAPLVAIRRDENFEPVPHWCFCVTTAGFWREIDGDWSRGPTWDDGGREVSDMGAVLWRQLADAGIEWHPILRTNAVDVHPVFFGIYGDLIYHHGAGSRTPMTRRDARGYRHLPVPLRNLAGVRKRAANTLLTHRMMRRVAEDERFYLELMGDGRG
jgi:hypothetical protein